MYPQMLHVPLQVSPSAVPTDADIPLLPEEKVVRTRSRKGTQGLSDIAEGNEFSRGSSAGVEPLENEKESSLQGRFVLYFGNEEFEIAYQSALLRRREERGAVVAAALLGVAVACALATYLRAMDYAQAPALALALPTVLALGAVAVVFATTPGSISWLYDPLFLCLGVLWTVHVDASAEHLWALLESWDLLLSTTDDIARIARAGSIVAVVALLARPGLPWCLAYATVAVPLFAVAAPGSVAALTFGGQAQCPLPNGEAPAAPPRHMVPVLIAMSAVIAYLRYNDEHADRCNFEQMLIASHRLRSERRHNRWLEERQMELERLQKALEMAQSSQGSRQEDWRQKTFASEASGAFASEVSGPSSAARAKTLGEQNRVPMLDAARSLEVIDLRAAGSLPGQSSDLGRPTSMKPNARLVQVMAGQRTDWIRVRRMAECIRHPGYSLPEFFDDCVASFPELKLFFDHAPAPGGVLLEESPSSRAKPVCASGRDGEAEFQRTIGALFAVYWLLRLDVDGPEGFCFGVDDNWVPRRPPQGLMVHRRKSLPPKRRSGTKPTTRQARARSVDSCQRKGKSRPDGGTRLRMPGEERVHMTMNELPTTTFTSADLPPMAPELSEGGITRVMSEGPASPHSSEATSNGPHSERPVSFGSQGVNDANRGSETSDILPQHSCSRRRGPGLYGGSTGSRSASKESSLKKQVKPFFKMSDDEKRASFYETMDWTMFAGLVLSAGCVGGPGHIDRVVALLCLTSFHDVMKVGSLLPRVQASHAPYAGVSAGAAINDHDAALSYVLEHYPDLLPSYAGLPPEQQRSVLFTQSKMNFNHGWLVQAEAPPGMVLSGFKSALSTGAHAQDVALYFLHWATDLAGAEGTPLGGAEKFTLKFPHAVFASFLHSIPFLTRLSQDTETQVFEDYLLERWRALDPGMDLPRGPTAIAQMRLALMAQTPDLRIVECLHALPCEEKAFLVEELARTGVEGQRYRCCLHGSVPLPGGPALLVYYGPALLQKHVEGGEPTDLHLALRVLCEVMSAARQLWPLSEDEQDTTVIIQISALKACSIDELVRCPRSSRREVWVLVRKNDREGSVELGSPSSVNDLYDRDATFRLLDFGTDLFLEL